MMIAGMASAVSGIQAGGRMLSVGAHNIANAKRKVLNEPVLFPKNRQPVVG
ncbi:MAG: hypothetical protein H0X47_09950 [Nitrospirales bacterium]|nr:hypothetical protein [Nitrospirales bacterium]